jgi:Flp pilus assembly protein TadG
MSRHGQRGSSLPEMAIVASALLALVFGIMDFGRALYTYGFVAQLAREGARWAIVRGSTCTVLDHCNAKSSDVQTYVESLSEGMTKSSSIAVTATWPNNNCNVAGCLVTVSVKYPFQFMTGILPSASFLISSTSQMVISQ